MRIVVSAQGKFHHFDLARELHARGHLATLFTGYPRWKLKDENLPLDRTDTFPWLMTPLLAANRWGLSLHSRAVRATSCLAAQAHDRHVARNVPDCDALIALSGRGLISGQVVQRRGGKYVCDRGSSHIVYQQRILHEEYERWGQKFPGIDPSMIDRELAEYERADVITVPSDFARRSFIDQGVPPAKLRKVPYGVRLERFSRTATPDLERFDVLFVGGVSFRKGVPDLLDAFSRLEHPRKSLTFVGGVAPEMKRYLREHSLSAEISFLGRWPQTRLREVMSRVHVMVLPSIEEGLALVQAQAMACGCPVIASENTGARDLFTDGQEGFIVPIRSPALITERLQELADDGDLRQRMSEAALSRTAGMGGWADYGEKMVRVVGRLVSTSKPSDSERSNCWRNPE